MSWTAASAGTDWTGSLGDGTPASIRPIRKGDAELERRFLDGMPEELLRHRFLGIVRDPDADVVRALTEIDPRCEAAFVAIVSPEGDEIEIGAARLRANPGGDSCDCAVAVSEEWRKRGVATLLMRHLIDAARSRGIRHMYTVDPAGCEDRHHLADRLGFRRRPDPDDPAAAIYELTLD